MKYLQAQIDDPTVNIYMQQSRVYSIYECARSLSHAHTTFAGGSILIAILILKHTKTYN
jgi:hypothetical protein